MKKGITLFIIILMELFTLMATAIGPHHLETVLKECTMTALVGMVNLVLGVFIGRTPKKKKRKARPSPTPPKRAPLSKEQFKRAFDIEGPGWVRTGWKLFPPGSIFSLIQHFHIFLHLQISFVLGNYFSNLLLHLFFFG